MGQKQSKPNQFHRSRSARQVIHTENIMFEDDALTNKNDLNIAVFSRRQKKHKSIKLKDKNQNGLFRGLPTLGESMHSKIGWKSTLAKHDQLAVSDPNALQRSVEVEQQFNQQGAWIMKQKKDMIQRNDR